MDKRFVLIERDGTLNIETHYLTHPDELKLIPGAGRAIKLLKAAGYGVCVVTSPTAVALGLIDEPRLERFHQRLGKLLQRFDVAVDGIHYCPHRPKEGCVCRTPQPGLVLQAMSEHRFSSTEAWVIGDQAVDIELGRSVGSRAIRVRTGYGRDFEQATRAD